MGNIYQKSLTNENIRAAASLWCEDSAQATVEYGSIEEWDTSEVTDMSNLFRDQTDFNEDIGKWDVSMVTNMSSMFRGTLSFNQDLSEWDVSNVTNMNCMFGGAIEFNQDLSGWNVSRVRDMSHMFSGATSFNQDLSGWHISRGANMYRMFRGAALTAMLQRTMNVSSFFEGVYRYMPREERQQVFAVVFHWKRRRAFILFLVNHGYLYSAHVASNYKDPGAT